MAGSLSKMLLFQQLNLNCYEIGHAWTPNCTEACLDIGLSTFQESIKIYFPLFLVPQLLKKKIDFQTFNYALKNSLRSSVFLSFNAYLAMLFFCTFRKAFGKFYYITTCWPPMFLASFMSIYLENPKRRGSLALYTINIASDSFFKSLIKNGYLPKISNFDTLIFTLSSGAYLYTIQKKGFSNDLFNTALKFVLSESDNLSEKLNLCNKNKNFIDEYDPKEDLVEKYNLFLSKHKSCNHLSPCFLNALNSFLKCFLVGTGLKIASKTLLRPKSLISNPKILIKESLSLSNIKFGTFLGMFSSMFKISNCFLRKLSNGKKEWHAFVASLVAGPFFYLSPNTSLAMYLMWKAIENIYNESLDRNLFNHKNYYPCLIYSMATAQIFYSVILEPDTVKPSYMKFVKRLTNDRIEYFNTSLFRNFFNLNSIQIDEKSLDKDFSGLNTKYTSEYYKQFISSQ